MAPVVHVLDASRAVGVVTSLISPETRGQVWAETREKFARMRASRTGGAKQRVPIEVARANRLKLNWSAYHAPQPAFIGAREVSFDLGTLSRYVDWTPYFASWDLAGRYPDILQDEVVGEAARSLWTDTQAMLQQMVGEGWLSPRGVVGFWPANAEGDDIVLWADERRRTPLARLHTLRQQMEKDADQPHLALSDFVAPVGQGADHVGAFAVTAGHGELERSEAFKAAGDDYGAIMVKALADRFAEAFAEALHEEVRRKLWGYAPDEAFDNAELIAEAYRGVRPAPGYPSQPDHTEKQTIFDLLDAPRHAGMELTSSMAMNPPASVSGLYLAHPQAAYFAVGRIAPDQVADYAARKGWDTPTAERWLRPLLGV
jgi:5-methyltetrahydrofolate--homocysteine methyltransferase